MLKSIIIIKITLKTYEVCKYFFLQILIFIIQKSSDSTNNHINSLEIVQRNTIAPDFDFNYIAQAANICPIIVLL